VGGCTLHKEARCSDRKMSVVFVVTSVIHTGSAPWSYTPGRSLFSAAERYEQTLCTIASIRQYVPGAKVLLVEGSHLSDEYRSGITAVCDWFHDVSALAETSTCCIQSPKKGLGDAWLLLCGLKYLQDQCIDAKTIFKMSGRYRLNEQFSLSRISDTQPTFRQISGTCCATFCFAVPGYMLGRYIQIVSETVAMYSGAQNPSLEDYLPRQFGAIHEIDCMGAEGIIAVDHSRQIYKV